MLEVWKDHPDLIVESKRLKLKDTLNNPIVSIRKFLTNTSALGKGVARKATHANLKFSKMQRDITTIIQSNSIKNKIKQNYDELEEYYSEVIERIMCLTNLLN